MNFNNFWYSYTNILLKEIYKKKYFSFTRKVFGTLYKYLLRNLRQIFSLKSINLDKIKNKNYFQKSLDELFIKFNCDKGSYCYWDNKKITSHNYSFFYEKYLSKFKKKPTTILEFGSHEGKGIAGLYFYFPEAKFIGVNNNPFQMRYHSKRIDELFVDVSSKKILENLSNHIKNKPDVIIDDASHNLKDILITFCIFFKKLNHGGIYVIEDADQFKVFKELNPYEGETTPLDIFTKIKNNESYTSSFISLEDQNYLIENVQSIYLEKGKMIMKGKNISDIIFIQKK